MKQKIFLPEMPQNQLKMEYLGKVWNFMEKFG
jgi:hypothetical protein